jgi:hypothetical protein
MDGLDREKILKRSRYASDVHLVRGIARARIKVKFDPRGRH